MIKKRLVVANGNYQDRNGNDKTRWVNIGALHEHDGKHYITLDAHINLAGLERKEGDTRVFVNMFDNDREDKPRQSENPADFDSGSELPF